MAAPFNQEVACDSGIKPYRDLARTGSWTAAYDGTTLSLRSLSGGETLGGVLDGSAERENYSGAALLRRQLGQTDGIIYFTKTLAGEIISTGHHKKSANASSDTEVECGDGREGPWINPAPDNPFRFEGGTLTWVPGIAQLNCAQRNSGGNFGAMIASNVIAFAEGGKLEIGNGSVTLIELQSSNDSSRTNSVVQDSARLAPGGVRVWQSVGADNTVSINVRYDNLVRQIQGNQNGVETYCAPSPLDPRF